MQKAVLGGIAALLLSATAASTAATTVTLDGFCNAYDIRKSDGGYTMKDTTCTTAIGAGQLGNVRTEGKTLIMGLEDPEVGGTQFVYKFSYPLITGGTWSLEKTTDGTHLVSVRNGNYSLPASAERGLHGKKSATSK